MSPAIKRISVTASCALAFTLVMSGMALAHDGDDDDHYRQGYPAQARNYGYHNGYQDGAKQGRERDPNDYQTPDRRQATRGYRDWMGPVDWYRRGYQEGYQNGFRDAYRNTTWNDRQGNERYGGGWQSDHPGYRFGYEDGTTAARSDIQLGKSYNSKPRGRYDDRDHGYHREYGSKDRYKDDYTAGYRAGYDANYRD